MSVITISRQAGSLGNEVADTLSKKLGWEMFTHEEILKNFLSEIVSDSELHSLEVSAKAFLKQSRIGVTFLEYLKNKIKEYSIGGSMILVGFGSQLIFRDASDTMHVRIISPREIRKSRIKKQYHVNDTEAEEIILHSDRRQRRFISVVFGVDLTDDHLYHLILNTADLSVSECACTIISLFNERELGIDIEDKTGHEKVITNVASIPIFKNPSEVEFTKILDMYQIDWIYEPKTFPIEWDAEGNILLAFSPDFYLTKFDTYIELTTMNQKYITRKNNKIKKLRELYPGTNIKLVNKKDYDLLIERFKSI